MSQTVIKAENISKQYRLGNIGTGTVSRDLERWFAKIRGKEDPFLKIGQENSLKKILMAENKQTQSTEFVWALKDINFEIKQGGVLGIIGKNGAGKSTLLKIISQITAPTTGSIKIKGRVASLLEIGTGFHPELTGRENVYLNGALLGMTRKEIKKKFDEIVDFSGVEQYIDTPVKRYSSGMYVRLAFAVAAHLEPEILVVDEVLAVGDAEFQKKCLGKMKDVSDKDGRTVLFVSHNMIAVQNLCKTGLLISRGNIDMFGNIHNVIEKYLNSNIEIASVKISDRTDRTGNQKLVFTDVKILNANNIGIETISVGQKVKFRLFFSNKNNQLKNVVIAMAINNYHGFQLSDISNESSNYELFNIEKNNGYFEIEFSKFCLVSGIYTVNLFCKVNGDISDWILNAFNFEVEAGDFYGTGKNMDKDQNLFLIDYKFKLIT